MSKGDDIELKFLQLSKKVKAMEFNNLKEVNAVGSSSLCIICEKVGHSTKDCHTITTFGEVL